MNSSGAPRLAYLTSQYPAASHTFIRREIEALRDQGWRIDTFSVRPPSAGETVAEADRSEASRTFYILRQSLFALSGAHIEAMFTRPLAYFHTLGLALTHRAPGSRGLFLGMAHFVESVLLARELRKRGISHLHNHFANSAATVGLLASRLLGIRWSFTMHGISETDYPAGLMLGRKIEAANFVVSVSYFGRAQGMRLVQPGNWDKMHVIRCGVPLDRLPPKSEHRGAPTIVCVGRLSPEKGQTGLLRAFARLRIRQRDLLLQLVGDGPDRAALMRLAAELGVNEAVSFTGRLSEQETLVEVSRADLLVLPSFMEGLPIVLMEAMALGVPVIASRVAGVPELVSDGKTGLLFAPSNWEELSHCMERLLSDKALCNSLVQSAKLKITSEFDTRRSATELSGLFLAAQAKG